MNETLLRSIEGKKRELDRLRPFNAAVVRKLEEQLALEWTYNSNGIEGNTLTLRETEVVLKQGLTIGGKSVKEHFEVLNHEDGIAYVRQTLTRQQPLTQEMIKALHQLILKNIDDEEAGVYRRHNVRIVGALLIPPQAVKIGRLMDELMVWFHGAGQTLPVPQLAAELHYRFVCIHPFIDGNGRVGRLLMNVVLMQNGYPPAVILKVDRNKYYRVLNEANQGKMAGFEAFVGRAIERSLIIYLNAVKPNTSEKQGLIPLKDAAQYCDYSAEYLSLLARKGKLSAVKLNRNWVTTREAVEEYVRVHGTK